MAEKKPYTSIIDAILDEREPNWKDLGLNEAQESGEEVADRTHQYVDKEFMDDIAESASKHTPVPPTGKSATYEERIAEKEAAAPRIHSVTAYRRMDEYKSEVGDNQSLMDEVTESMESAAKNNNLAENSAEKKAISDAQIQKYIRDLLNSGTSPAKVAAKLEKIAEIELFNHQSATDYLQRNAGLLGLAYLEPNTYMDKNSPTYERTAAQKRAYDKPQEDCPRSEKNQCDDTDPERCSGGGYDAPCDCATCHPSAKKTSNACVQQKKAWDNKGIKPQAKSVKQVNACQGCTYQKRTGSTKTCTLYGLPLVANVNELTQIVNHLTAGVPQKQKHAALVQIANGDDKRAKTAQSILTQTDWVKTADAKVRNQEKRASYQFADERETSQKFSSEHVTKLHAKGASLEQIYKWASPKFGDVEVSMAFRGFVQDLKKNAKGHIVVASADLKFLNELGIRNAAFEGAAKCASCPNHYASQHRPVEENRGAQRVEAKFASSTIDKVRNKYDERIGTLMRNGKVVYYAYIGGELVESPNRAEVEQALAGDKEVVVTAAKVRTLHQAGHSVQKIYNGAASKVGSVQARKAIAGFVEDMKKRPGKIAVSEQDRAFLVGKLGFKPEQVRMLDPQRRPVTQVVASVPDDQHLLSYPGMEKHAGEKKATDGHAILAEFDLTGGHDMQDIDTSGPKRDDVEISDHFKVDLE